MSCAPSWHDLPRITANRCDRHGHHYPHSLNDRAQDNWEPLLAIAMTAGDEWLQNGNNGGAETVRG